MSRGDPWDTPGGHGGREALEALAGRFHSPGVGSARALHVKWRETMDEIDDGTVLRRTVSPQEFNTFRRKRLDEGITDAQLASSFEIFVTAVIHGRARVLHNDLWRTYSLTWARWTAEAYEPVTGPVRGRRRDPGYQP